MDNAWITNEEKIGLKEYNFISGAKSDFQSKKYSANKCYGDYSCDIPSITVIITTYKRPKMLKQALDSAINQIGFDDYEIIVVDNECEKIEIITGTQQVIEACDCQKVIYYRNTEQAYFRMDWAMSLARTKWIMFLHDDDILANNALKILNQIVENDKDVKWISGLMTSFELEKDFCVDNGNNNGMTERVTVSKHNPFWGIFGVQPNWVGTLIDRESYLAIGGMPLYSLDGGDHAMVAKFAFDNRMYRIEEGPALYYYRVWNGQSTQNDFRTMNRTYATRCMIVRDICKKAVFGKKILFYLGWINLRLGIDSRCDDFEYEPLIKIIDIPKSWCNHNKIYSISCCLVYAIRRMINWYRKNFSQIIEVDL